MHVTSKCEYRAEVVEIPIQSLACGLVLHNALPESLKEHAPLLLITLEPAPFTFTGHYKTWTLDWTRNDLYRLHLNTLEGKCGSLWDGDKAGSITR